jgi:SPP1 gp7 family putative phage head morphogenesis protein
VFAAFKNHDEQNALAKLLVDENGEPRQLNDFIKEARPLTEQYNVEWLKTEFSQAKASAQMAVKWEGFKENADLYPNLQYRTVGDTEVRPEHAVLNGLIAPINDPIWNSIYPPNGWGCRCNVTQTDKEVYRPDEAKGFEPDKGFDFNPGKDQKLFSEKTSYTVTGKQATELEKQGKELLKERK